MIFEETKKYSFYKIYTKILKVEIRLKKEH